MVKKERNIFFHPHWEAVAMREEKALSVHINIFYLVFIQVYYSVHSDLTLYMLMVEPSVFLFIIKLRKL